MTVIDNLRATVSLPDVAASFGLALERNGHEFECCCCFHSENTPSLTFFQGKDHVWRFHCFGCGERGDVIDFVEKIKGCDTREAVAILGGKSSRPNVQPRAIAEARDAYKGIKMLTPRAAPEVGKPLKLWNPKREKFGTVRPSMVFPYSNGGFVLRNEFQDGSKETPMVAWCRLPSGEETWCRYPFPKPRPLYGVERLSSGQVIIVEGEKCADAMRRYGRNSVSWAGGTYGLAHADWSVLAGRSVVIWPDADDPGRSTAAKLAGQLYGLGCAVKVMGV